jgi:hypothetical protein
VREVQEAEAEVESELELSSEVQPISPLLKLLEPPQRREPLVEKMALLPDHRSFPYLRFFEQAFP